MSAGFAPALPFYGPTLLIERAYGTAIGIEPAVPHLVVVLGLFVALAYLFFRMLSESEAEDQRAERYAA